MIRSEFVDKIYTKYNFTEEQSILSVKTILKVLTDSLTQGKRIEVRDFGSFNLRIGAERNAHNPKTGEKLRTKSKKAIHFKPGKELKKRVDESRTNIDIVDDQID